MIGREKVTIFEGVPTMYSALLHHPDRATADVSSLRLCVSGGAALPVEVLREFEEAFGCPILEGYGLSETSPVASFNHPDRVAQAGLDRHPDRRGGDARRRRLRRRRAAGEVGEIAIRGHNVMKGYWRKPDATAAAIPDGWFRTGDLARIDEDGYFFIVDRKKELIIRGGYNVYPREIEEALHEHPAVAEVAVVGIPHDSLGEEVGAAVALKPGATATPDELKAFAKSQGGRLQVPTGTSGWWTSCPKGPTGKILRREVKPPRGRAGGARDRAGGDGRRAEDFADVADAAPALDLLLSDAALGITAPVPARRLHAPARPEPGPAAVDGDPPVGRAGR